MRPTTPNKNSAKPTFQKHPLTVAIHLACGAMIGVSPLAMASPTGGDVVGGTGTIVQSGATTTINQATQNLAINWQTFNVGADERVQFIQPNATSIVLNRILSNDGSVIAGRIDANGRVFLVNANGILFTSSASLNVGSLIASSLDINPSDFMNGQYVFHDLPGTSGKIVNQGLINASLGGNVALLGKQVQNDGMIVANLGSVTLAAGKQAVLTFEDGGLLGVRITEAMLQQDLGLDPAVLNNGSIQAQGGRVLLTASQSQDVFSKAVNTNGAEPATSVVVNADGSFTLGSGADVVNTGSVDVSGTATGQKGGQIVLLGNNVTSSGILKADALSGNGGMIELNSSNMTLLTQNSVTSARSEADGVGGIVKALGTDVGLFDFAAVDVSGATGGGEALIGGDYHGDNVFINNASGTYVSAGSEISADATQSGNGGKVIVWGTDSAKVYGAISARGGAIGGDGGFVETSGGYVDLNPQINVSATNGKVGSWLIDPYSVDITIGGTTDATITKSGVDTAFTANANNSTLTVASLDNALSSGSAVTVQTAAGGSVAESAGGGNIHVIGDINLDAANSSIANPATLTLNALHDIIIDGHIYDQNNANDRINLILNANTNRADVSNGGGSVFINNIVETIGGNFSATGDSINIGVGTGNKGAVLTTGGKVDLIATSGSINLGSTSTGQKSLIDSGNGQISFQGNVILSDTVSINAGNGNIRFYNKVDGDGFAARGLSTYTAGAVTFSDAVGSSNRLGALDIAASGDVNTTSIAATSLTVNDPNNKTGVASFTSGTIDTSSSSGDGGNVAVNSSGIVTVGEIVSTGSTTGNTRGDSVSIAAQQIVLNGDINSGTATNGTALVSDLSLTSSGSVTINYANDFTSPINITGSNGSDFLIAANRTNSWTIDSANQGSLNVNATNSIPGITFKDIENLKGGNGVDTFVLANGGSLGGYIDGADGFDTVDLSKLSKVEINLSGAAYANIEKYIGNGSDSTLIGKNIQNDWLIDGSNSGSLNLGSTSNAVIFEGFNKLVGNNNTDNFTFSNTGTLTFGGSIDGKLGNNSLTVNGAVGNSMYLSGSMFTASGLASVAYTSMNDITLNGGASMYIDSANISGSLTLANTTGAVTTSASGITAGSLILDRIGSAGASTSAPLLTNISNLSILNSGPVYIRDAAGATGATLTLGPINTGNIVDISADRNVSSSAALLSTAAFTVRSTGDIRLENTGNILSGGISLQQIDIPTTPASSAIPTTVPTNTVTLTNQGDTNLASINAGSFALNVSSGPSAGNVQDSGTVHVTNGLTVHTPGTLNLTHLDQIASGDLSATTINLHTANGIGTTTALQTLTSDLTVLNDRGGVSITNLIPVSVSISNHGDINFDNTGNVTIRQLHTFDPASAGPSGTITLNVNGSVYGNPAYSNLDKDLMAHPDIMALNFNGNIVGDIGSPLRRMSVSVINDFTLRARNAYLYFNPYPRTQTIDALTVSISGDSSGISEQLLEIESLGDFDPAIFTEVRNYYYEDVAILMPADQRLDGTGSDDEEKDKEDTKEEAKPN